MQIYLINLDRSPDRLARMRDVFGKFGLEFTRVAAIDGNHLSEQEFARWTEQRNWPRPLTRAELGCFLSHRECLQLGLEQGAPYFAIFEDDVLLAPKMGQFLQSDSWIATGTDIVKLDTADIRCLLKPLQQIGIEPYQSGRLVSKHFCTGGYIISREAAQHFLTLVQYAFAPIDEIYFNPDCGILQRLNVQQLVPAPVVQAGLMSTIRHPSSQPSAQRKPRSPLYHLPRRVMRELRRFYKRYVRPFCYQWLKGYHWGKIPFG